MRARILAAAATLVVVLVGAAPAHAQQEVPNPMAAHTVFIIVITGAFLVWAASYSLHFYRDRDDRREQERQAIGDRRNALLDEIAELETGHDSGTIDLSRYKKRMKALRGELARTIGRLESADARRTKPRSAGRKRA
jgi:septal ring factor EnvC (AmiA/AmiB activator)